MPCWWQDLACLHQFEKGMAAGTWDVTNIVVSSSTQALLIISSLFLWAYIPTTFNISQCISIRLFVLSAGTALVCWHMGYSRQAEE